MSRIRALISLLLATAWCALALHADLEAAGLMWDHEHHAHHEAHDHGASTGAHDDHEFIVGLDVVKDGQFRLNAMALLSLAFVGLVVAWALWLRPTRETLCAVPLRGRSDPPFHRVWQFVQRCAAESVAPPALA